jgi:hypothetical protein
VPLRDGHQESGGEYICDCAEATARKSQKSKNG